MIPQKCMGCQEEFDHLCRTHRLCGSCHRQYDQVMSALDYEVEREVRAAVKAAVGRTPARDFFEEFYSQVLCTDCGGVVSCEGDSCSCDDCGTAWDPDGVGGRTPKEAL